MDDEHRRKISEGYKALHIHRTEEHKEAIRQANLERWRKWHEENDKVETEYWRREKAKRIAKISKDATN